MKSSAWVIGRQAFDGLGRQITVEVGGRSTGFDYQPGRLPTCANQLPDGTRIDYTYEANLDERPLTIAPAGEAIHAFAYDPVLGLPSSRSGPLGTLEFRHERSGRPVEDVLTIDGQVHSTQWRYSLNKQLCGLTNALGADHTYHYDASGRLAQHVQGEITTTFTYDTFSRIDTLTTTHGKNTLVRTLTYDSQGREHSRTFSLDTAGKHQKCTQTLGYTDLDQVAKRTWEDGNHIGGETFSYDNLGRLVRYTADIAVAPEDPFGNRVIEQTFALNALDGYTEVHSRFANGGTDQATFFYDNPADPTQVSRITHTHASWPAQIDLTYDACGRVIADSLGRQLTWDAQSRLVRVDYQGQRCDYRYGPSGELIDRVLNGALTRCFFSGDLLTHEQTGKEVLQRIGDSTTLFALNRITEGVRKVTLIGCDAQRSVRVEADDTLRTRRYSAHGAEAEAAGNGPYGYVGERREPLTGWYLPGGNRPYDPIVMGFLSPDDESPFGRGGLNPYAYCGGDPINRIDPDGHAWWTWVIAGVGTVLGVVGTVATLGAAAPAFAALLAGGLSTLTATSVMAMTAATLSVVALGTGIASTVLEATNTDSKAASILGWISLGTGLASTALELAPKSTSASNRQSRSMGRGSSKAAKSVKMAPGPNLNSFVSSAPITPRKTSVPIVLHYTDTLVPEVAYHPNYLGSGYSAFETHGTKSGLLMDSSGKMVRPERVALEIQDWMVANGRPDGEPFTLVACWAGKSGAAQKVSDVTGRPVTAYMDVIVVEDPLLSTTLTNKTIPVVEAPKSWWAALTGQPTQYTPAPSRIFIPQVRIV